MSFICVKITSYSRKCLPKIAFYKKYPYKSFKICAKIGYRVESKTQIQSVFYIPMIFLFWFVFFLNSSNVKQKVLVS